MADHTIKQAVFAGGCFWCTEAQFAGTEGVISVTSGYTGGALKNPTYEQVASKKTGHAEAVKIVYDSAKVDYAQLLDIFWSGIDPTDPGGQFFDRGAPYRTAVFYADDEQKRTAEASKAAAQTHIGHEIVTQIEPLGAFYAAEQHHQNYYQKNALHYNAYKKGSGREKKLKEIWES